MNSLLQYSSSVACGQRTCQVLASAVEVELPSARIDRTVVGCSGFRLDADIDAKSVNHGVAPIKSVEIWKRANELPPISFCKEGA